MTKRAIALVFALALAASVANASVAKHVASDSKGAVVSLAKDGGAVVSYAAKGVYRGFRRGFKQVFGK